MNFRKADLILTCIYTIIWLVSCFIDVSRISAVVKVPAQQFTNLVMKGLFQQGLWIENVSDLSLCRSLPNIRVVLFHQIILSVRRRGFVASPPAPPPQKTNAIVADAGFVNLVIVSDLIKRASLSF